MSTGPWTYFLSFVLSTPLIVLCLKEKYDWAAMVGYPHRCDHFLIFLSERGKHLPNFLLERCPWLNQAVLVPVQLITDTQTRIPRIPACR